MASHDDVIAFLESEAEALRARIADLEAKDYPRGPTTGDGDAPRWADDLAAAKAKLADVETHVRTLRQTP